MGKRERIPPPTYDPNNPDTFANSQDLNNIWVVINPQTGLVTSGQLTPVLAWSGTTNYAPGDAVSVGTAYYICTQANTNQAPATSSGYWISTINNTAILAVDAANVGSRSLAHDFQGMGEVR